MAKIFGDVGELAQLFGAGPNTPVDRSNRGVLAYCNIR